MSRGLRFAGRTFSWAGVYGIVALVPMFFLEGPIGRAFPPATNHPELYYGFLGVALAWQFVFLVIGRDPARYRPLMLPAIAEKLLPGGAAVWLALAGRLAPAALGPFVIDLALGALFAASWVRTRGDGRA